MKKLNDTEFNEELNEWISSIDDLIRIHGIDYASNIIENLIGAAKIKGLKLPSITSTDYVNTINKDDQIPSPGDHEIEHTIRSYVRWNAAAMVLRANKNTNVGGHIASFASAATLYDVGYNHFWKSSNDKFLGDLIFMQGHSAPGMYARAFMLGRLSEEQMDNYRQEVDGNGLSSYPHPWLMPDFWQFPTVSMGLGPLMAIYQARFMKYLEDRNLLKTDNRKVWCFLGDGEVDEPESMGAIGVASREKLDNLIFVVNCNLQRLDGPVRGNGKIIQELESDFRGAGWNVIKLIWGSYWDPLLAMDSSGLLRQRMAECLDGEYQTFKSKDGAYVRDYFFGKYPELKKMVRHMTDDDIWRLNRGGHDPHKIYAAYHAAANHKNQPTVILAKTIKGYGMGEAGEAQNITHQQKKMGTTSLKEFRDKFKIPISDDKLDDIPYLKLEEDSKEFNYMLECRKKLGGFLPIRRRKGDELKIPKIDFFESVLGGSNDREISTTMAFVRILNLLLRDKNLKNRIVPIVPDESRTFGMEGMFRQLGIWSSVGQLYTPEDADQLMFYKEDKNGQILQEGINEAGAMSSWIAAATSYSNHGISMIPFYIFYSMFGFQRIGDLAWAAGDQRAKGFLLGGTAGRTTLNGEGLQHEDGHSHIISSTIPNCISYDPTFGYELAVIIQNGLERMFQNDENVFYYITVMNENYNHPSIPKNVTSGILKGMYLFSKSENNKKPTVQLLGSGTILNEVIKAKKLLKKFDIDAEIWSCPSFTELAREGNNCLRDNILNNKENVPYVSKCLNNNDFPVVAATDYVKAFPDQIRKFISKPFYCLGTDGYGRSDTREKLRKFFEVSSEYVAFTAIHSLFKSKKISKDLLKKAVKELNIDTKKTNPFYV